MLNLRLSSAEKTLLTQLRHKTEVSSRSWMIDYGLRRSYFSNEICSVCKQSQVKRYILHPFPLPYPHGKGQWLTLDCACIKKERSKERLKKNKILVTQRQHPLPPALRENTFKNFRVDAYNQNAYETCLKFTEKFEQIKGDQGLLLLGRAGVGKTHLASAIANVLQEKHSVIFAYVPGLLEKMRNANLSLEPLLNADLLVLDDLGSERSTDWTVERLLIIVDGRLNNFKPTVFTSNYDTVDFDARLGMRTASRILGNNLQLEIGGPDWRQVRSRQYY